MSTIEATAVPPNPVICDFLKWYQQQPEFAEAPDSTARPGSDAAGSIDFLDVSGDTVFQYCASRDFDGPAWMLWSAYRQATYKPRVRALPGGTADDPYRDGDEKHLLPEELVEGFVRRHGMSQQSESEFRKKLSAS